MNIGILGVGVIGTAIVEGFCYDNDMTHNVFLSPRGRKHVDYLTNTFDNVHRCDSNQEVLDYSDVVIVSILPEIGLEVLSSLKFKEDHHVINLMRNIKLDEIESVIGKTKSLVHMVPLSFISKRIGPIAIYPKNDTVNNLFDHLGHVIAYDSMSKIESVAAITGLMTSYYRLLYVVSDWGVSNGLSMNEAVGYTSSFFESLTLHANKGDLKKLSHEVTPGGINEFALEQMNKLQVYPEIISTLETMLKEIKNN